MDAEWETLEDEGFIGLVGPIYRGRQTGQECCFRFVAQPKHRNRGGFVQGGMLMTFADRALGATARGADLDRIQATMQFDMHFIRPVKIGESVEIRCKVVQETRTVAFVEGSIYADDKLAANAKGIWKIIKPALATETPETSSVVPSP